jgi:hypothetical protein
VRSLSLFELDAGARIRTCDKISGLPRRVAQQTSQHTRCASVPRLLSFIIYYHSRFRHLPLLFVRVIGDARAG